MRIVLSCLLFVLTLPGLTQAAGEPAIRAVGVVGNTGEQGSALLQQTTDASYRGHGSALGCGVALDRKGTLWTRMDDGFVTRLSLDGRQLARFSAPKSASGFDTIVSIGDRVLLLSSNELYSLPIAATPGSAFKSLGIKLRALAHNPVKDRLAAITEDGRIVWVRPADGGVEPVATLPDAWLIEADDSGNLFIGTRANPRLDGQMHKFSNGKEVIGGGWPKGWDLVIPGIAATPSVLQWDDGGFFYSGPGFVSRFDADLAPSPGTVLGCQGKTVIGIGADWRSELVTARSTVRVRAGLYVIGGGWGQPFFAEWPDTAKSMKLVSWFSARPECRALNVDADGNVFADRLVYVWNATPDSFPTEGQGSASIVSQIVRAGPRLLVRLDRWAHGGAGAWGLPLYSGDRMQNSDWLNQEKVDTEQWWGTANKNSSRVFPSVIYRQKEGLVFLTLVDASGGRALLLHDNGRYRATGGRVAFKTATAGRELTSLAMKDDKALLAAIDGSVVEFSAAGDDWQETRRWNNWGNAPADRFGGNISIATDQGCLLVSDSDRHRVLWFGAEGGKPKAQFGKTDRPGSDLAALNKPGLLAVNGSRLVVFDSGNQRLMKLMLER